jgi:succinyl-diaminopimelate desuccinylase
MDELELIFREVDNLNKEDIMNLIRSLINVKTIVPPGDNYREYIDVISPYFEVLGYSLEEVIVPNELIKEIPLDLKGPRVNLIAKKDFGQENEVTFYGHMDVVPAPTEGIQKWRFPPFEATMIKSGKIYGRGVGDMKGSMACLILALQIIEKLNLTPIYNISVMNCTDEEIGVWPGIRYLAEQGYVKGIVFCMEYDIHPTILVGAAGTLDVTVETIGKSCHSGMNFLGVNALEEMVPIMVELLELKKNVEKRESKDIPFYKNQNLTPMFNLDIIRAGEKSNIVPDFCQLVINRRLIPDEDYLDVKQEIIDAIERGKKRSKALDVKMHFNYMYPAFRTDIYGPGITRMKEVMKLVQDIPENKINYTGMAGSLDMSYVAQILNTQDIIIHGVGNNSNVHGINEVIQLKDIKMYIKELLVFLCADL